LKCLRDGNRVEDRLRTCPYCSFKSIDAIPVQPFPRYFRLTAPPFFFARIIRQKGSFSKFGIAIALLIDLIKEEGRDREFPIAKNL
jgi:hypothetical protein